MKKHTIFVYGTLSFDEVLSALLGRKARGTPSKISGFKRIYIKNKRYPGLVKSAGTDLVEGMLHNDITDSEFKLLDTFEDDFYQRIMVKIRLGDKQLAKAEVYIVPKQNMKFATKIVWNREEFGSKYKDEYLGMAKKFRANYLDGIRKSQEF